MRVMRGRGGGGRRPLRLQLSDLTRLLTVTPPNPTSPYLQEWAEAKALALVALLSSMPVEAAACGITYGLMSAHFPNTFEPESCPPTTTELVEVITSKIQNQVDVKQVDLPEGEEVEIVDDQLPAAEEEDEKCAVIKEENDEFAAAEGDEDEILSMDGEDDHFLDAHQVPGPKRQPLYTVGDGFYYRCDTQYRDGSYRLRCPFSHSSGCHGTATMKIEGETLSLQPRQGHICHPNHTFGEVNGLKARLNEQAAANITGSLRQIFDEECRNVRPEVASQISFNSVESGMRRARSAAAHQVRQH